MKNIYLTSASLGQIYFINIFIFTKIEFLYFGFLLISPWSILEIYDVKAKQIVFLRCFSLIFSPLDSEL